LGLKSVLDQLWFDLELMLIPLSTVGVLGELVLKIVSFLVIVEQLFLNKPLLVTGELSCSTHAFLLSSYRRFIVHHYFAGWLL
jgi:hypothetical protein